MKSIFKLTALAILFSCNMLFAQDNKMAEMTPEQRADMRVERFNKDLNLSSAQATQLKDLFLKQESTRGEGEEKQKEFRQNFQTELNKILTPEQQTKLKALREERRNQTQFPNEQGKKDGKNEEVK